MRLIIFTSLLLVLFSILLPLFLVGQVDPLTYPSPDKAALLQKPALDDTLVAIPHDDGQDATLLLRVFVEDEIVELSMADFLYGVVAAEMPARFHPEALRAQAVAARTYTLHRMLISPSPRHPDAQVCGSYACCKAFHTPERLRERWGAQYAHYSALIRAAVADTDGIVLVYDNAPILAAFHASSYGSTEASSAIWNSVPYLQSVETFESMEDVPNYYAETRFSFSEFRQIAQANIPGTVLNDGNKPYWISDVQYTDSGRLHSLHIGGISVTGAQFRQIFGLRSTAITFFFDAESISLQTGGHGHGVGMSQFGANTMANRGHPFYEILLWYYTNVTFARMSEVLALQ